MTAYEHIIGKLLRFSRRYYAKVLIKGIILFLALGFLFFLATLSVEYFLWLNSTGRLALLVGFLTTEIYLLVRFIIIPVIYLLRIKEGITDRDASRIIGKHFSEVDDKLINLLELAEDRNKSELLLASIAQRSSELREIPFGKAIDLRESLKYVKYLLIPLALFLIIGISGNLSSFLGTYNRVVNYDVAYEPPAPFQFRVMAGDLSVLETEEVIVKVATEGDVKPDEIRIVIGERSNLMQNIDGVFQHTFSPPLTDAEFYFEANGFRSRTYQLEALQVPVIQDFKLVLKYPAYVNKASETLNSTGNATFPEGTRVTWEIAGLNTDEIALMEGDSIQLFEKKNELFSLARTVYNNLDYQLSTSNINARAFEKLNYRFKVIRDNMPSIKAREVIDSINPNVRYYSGETADDYQLVSLKLICYPINRTEERQEILLDRPFTNFKQFYYTFPSGLQLQEGEEYEFYFEVMDNDAIRGGKKVKSQLFRTRVLNNNELNNKQLDMQRSILDDLDRSMEGLKKQEKDLEEINRDQKEKNSLTFNDQNKIKEFLNKQERQEQMMQKFSRQLKENLEQGDKDEQLSKLLQERLERQEIEARKNEKLLDELKKIADKLEKEELTQRLEELGKSQKNSERNLEQLLELTKRYYVTEKASQLARELEEMAQLQEALSKARKDSVNLDSQEKINSDFEELTEELKELDKDNQKLQKPLPLPMDKNLEEGAKNDQKEAVEELNREQEESSQNEENEEKQNSQSKAGKKQKSASEKIQQMSEELKASSAGASGGSSITEDAEMLRQILENLVTFSFKQESLFDQLEGRDLDITHFSSVVKKQKDLRDLFEHVDDSLFSLSLRRAELSEFVNEQIGEVYYNIDKSVESIVEGRIYQGVSYQQYVLTAANSLADFLANILDNMQQSMAAGAGSSGQGENFQLPDIIKGQQELGERMGQMQGQGQQGSKGKPENGEGSKPGEGAEDGQDGESGSGNKGEQGDGKEGEGQGSRGKEEGQGQGMGTEENMAEIYEIYKQQQQLRQMLEKQLEDMLRTRDKQLTKKLLQQMEDFENDLLRNGITEKTINRANAIQHQMMRLENAALSQGKKEEREGKTNKEDFYNPITTKPKALEDLKMDIEILNRQALPLHRIYQQRVKEYFNAQD
ncbi:MAG: hypothetical protein WBM43_02920 [Flavobacteriaceae bacterium]